jgi:hypothetical protein
MTGFEDLAREAQRLGEHYTGCSSTLCATT